MKISNMLLRFCQQTGRAMLTPDEVAKIKWLTDEIKRVNGHYEKFAVGAAKRKLDKARAAYGENPSDENRAALDGVRATWLEEDRENTAQRVIITRVLTQLSTDNLKTLLPPIVQRAANALAWMSLEVQQEERKLHELYEIAYDPGKSAISFALLNAARCLIAVRDRTKHPQFRENCAPADIVYLDWLPELMETKGDVWENGPDPYERDSAKWRDIGQFNNPIFSPLIMMPAASVSDSPPSAETRPAPRGKGVNKYSGKPAIPQAAAAAI